MSDDREYAGSVSLIVTGKTLDPELISLGLDWEISIWLQEDPRERKVPCPDCYVAGTLRHP